MSKAPARAEHHRELERRRRYYPALDGLRAVAITGVIWHHSLPGPVPGWLGRGHAGVPLFFALSGYLITTLLLAERRATGNIALGAFWARRSLRIFPLYYATLAGFALLCAAHEPTDATRHFAASLPFYASYTSNWFVDFAVPHPVWFAFGWSLATEEQFYVWWPTFLRHAERLGRGVAPLGLLLVVGIDQLAEFGTLSSWLPRDGTLARMLTSVSAAMALGAGLAWMLAQPRGFAWLRRALAARHATSLAAALAAAWIWQPFGPGIVLDLAFVALVGAAAMSSENPVSSKKGAAGDGLIQRVLAARPLVYVGRVSYGMYLFHVPVLGLLQRSFPRGFTSGSFTSGGVEHPLESFVLAFAASVGVAAVSHRYVEAPILALQERFRPARGALADAALSPAAVPASARAPIGWVREG